MLERYEMIEILIWFATATILFSVALLIGRTVYCQTAIKRINLYGSTIVFANLTAVIILGYHPVPVLDLSGRKNSSLNSPVFQTPWEPAEETGSPRTEKHIGNSKTDISIIPYASQRAKISQIDFSDIEPQFHWSQVSFLLLFVWIFGAIGSLVKLFREYLKSKKLLLSCYPAKEADINASASYAAMQVGMSKKPRILLSTSTVSPCVVDPLNPTVVLPETLLHQLDRKGLDSVLIHEFSHFKNCDITWNFLFRICIAFHWFNPLSYRLLNELRISQEERCDNQVIQSENRFCYAKLLVNTNQLYGAKFDLISAPITTCNKTIQSRILWLLDASRDHEPRSKPSLRWLTLATILFLYFVIGSLTTIIEEKSFAQLDPQDVGSDLNSKTEKYHSPSSILSDFGFVSPNAVLQDDARQDPRRLHSDRFIRKIAKQNIEIAMVKAKGDILKIPALPVIPAGRTLSRKKLFTALGLNENQIANFKQVHHNKVHLLTWQISPSYNIVLMTAARDVRNDRIDWKDNRLQVYGVRIIPTEESRKKIAATARKMRIFFYKTALSREGLGRSVSQVFSFQRVIGSN